MRSILARLRTRLIERLVLYLAQPVRQYKAAESADLQALALLRLPFRVPPVSEGATRFICSSLLAQAFVLVGHPVLPSHVRVRDPSASDLRYVTPRDFESATGFEVIGRS
jgi:hypothetical protein